MTITVAITPEVQAELARQAAAHGRAVEAYAASILEAAMHLPGGGAKPSADRIDNILREIAQFSHKIPSLPDEAFTRESIYRDQD
jgi:plasmid stability protein